MEVAEIEAGGGLPARLGLSRGAFVSGAASRTACWASARGLRPLEQVHGQHAHLADDVDGPRV